MQAKEISALKHQRFKLYTVYCNHVINICASAHSRTPHKSDNDIVPVAPQQRHTPSGVAGRLSTTECSTTETVLSKQNSHTAGRCATCNTSHPVEHLTCCRQCTCFTQAPKLFHNGSACRQEHNVPSPAYARPLDVYRTFCNSANSLIIQTSFTHYSGIPHSSSLRPW